MITPAITALSIPNQAAAGAGNTGTGFADLIPSQASSGIENFGFNPALLFKAMGFGQWSKNADNVGSSLKTAVDIIPEMTYFVNLVNEARNSEKRTDFNSPNFAQETLDKTMGMMEPSKKIILALAEANGSDPTKQLNNIKTMQTNLPHLFRWLQEMSTNSQRARTPTNY